MVKEEFCSIQIMQWIFLLLQKKHDTRHLCSENERGFYPAYFGSYLRFLFCTLSSAYCVHCPSSRGVTVRISRVWTKPNFMHKSCIFT